uniref:BTB domain-containing protein n=1 Tax=Ditylenchus dipsaci TaxID=166011 RepID=A0A915D801_9BILA
MSDVVIIAENQRFPAHKFLLSVRSNYFKAMFGTGMRESTQQDITLIDTPAKPFSLLLRYVYTGQMVLHADDYQQTIEVLALANKYEFPVLQEQIVAHLHAILSLENVCAIYFAAELFSSEPLLDSCIYFLEMSKLDIVTSKAFLNFSLDVVKVIVEKLVWSENIEALIYGLKRWIIANDEQIEHIRPIIKPMQLELIQIDQKLHIVKSFGVIEKQDQKAASK